MYVFVVAYVKCQQPLVIGRQPDSDPSNPLTWGEDAVICDPWSNKTYRAQEYLSQLKNFYRTLSFSQGYINHTEDFNIRRHKLKPFLNYNSKYLKENSAQTLETLLKIYDCLYEKYLDIYNTFLNEIRKINKDIESKYGKNDPRYQSLILKIDSIQSIIDSCRNKALFEKAMIGENLIFVENMMNIQKTFKARVGKIKNEANEIPKELTKYSFIQFIMHVLGSKKCPGEQYRQALLKIRKEVKGIGDNITIDSLNKKI